MTCITPSVVEFRESKVLIFSTHSLNNRTTAAHNTDVSGGLHEVGSADSLALVDVVLVQKHAAEALQRVVGATSDLGITQEQ
jgi:hypothetical protein